MGGPGPLSLPRLFVYGTLRSGARAASLMAGAKRLGAARLRGRLYDLGSYPGAVSSDDPAETVHGELFELPPHDVVAQLERLDRYEGPEFRRRRLRVTLVGGASCESWVYLYTGDVADLPRIASGDFATGPGWR